MLEIEITRDRYESAVRYGDAVPFNPRVHVPCTPAWLRSYQLACRRDDLFAYIHQKTGTMVMAVWYFPPGKPHPIGLMTELETSEPVEILPRKFWTRGLWIPPAKDYMVSRCRPLEEQLSAWMRSEEAERRAELNALHENKADRQEAARYLRNRGMGEEAHNIENYSTPFERPADGSDQGVLASL